MRRSLGCLGLLLILLAVAAGLSASYMWGGKGPLTHNITVTVAPGSSLAATSEQLEKVGAISSASRFRLFARFLGGGNGIKAGEYRIAAHLSQSDILRILQGTKTVQRLVTIPEGRPAVEVRDILMKEDGLTGSVDVPVEGTVLPDSYAYKRGDTRAFVLKRMQHAMVAYLATAWDKRQPGIAVTTPRDALILASIVEKETARPDERRMVAAVYSNRLKRGMKLEADPTIIYPITKGRALGRRILQSEIDAKNDYNTYSMTGLPAGPICNPGRASIDAVLNPAQSNAIFFVADGTGGSVFSDTYAQHSVNVDKWRAIRRQRGEIP